MSERPPPYQPLVEGEYDWNSSESPPQPHQVHPPQQSAAANDTVVSQGLHWTPSTAKFGADPLSNFECPHCQIVVTTRTREVVAWNSYLCLILGCILCGVLALPLLCMLNYSDVEHYCPACGESVGTYVQE